MVARPRTGSETGSETGPQAGRLTLIIYSYSHMAHGTWHMVGKESVDFALSRCDDTVDGNLTFRAERWIPGRFLLHSPRA